MSLGRIEIRCNCQVNCTIQLLVLKLKKCKDKKVKDQKVKKLNLSFFYSKVKIKSECFNF
jgi:hypothetical protein